MILQKISGAYTMHSFVAKTSSMKYLHRWATRADDPICLSDFERVKPVPGWKPKLDPSTLKVNFEGLMNDADFVAYVDHLTANTSTVSAGSNGPSLTLDNVLQAIDTAPWEEVAQWQSTEPAEWESDYEPDLSFDE